MTEIKDLANLERPERITLKLEDNSVYCHVLCADKKRTILNDEYSEKIYHVQDSQENGIFDAFREDIKNNSATFLEENVTLTY